MSEEDTLSAIQMWQSIADGEWCLENRLWCESVASRLLSIIGLNQDSPEVIDPKRRPEEIQKAVGLVGKTKDLARMYEIENICTVNYMFENLEKKETLKDINDQLRIELLKRGLVNEETDIDKLTHRIKKKYSIKKR